MSLDALILRALRKAPAGISPTQLAAETSTAPATVWSRIAELRRLGYEIESTPHLGYCLRAVPSILHADDILSRLGPTCVLGRDIQVFRQTTSTNDVLDQMAHAGVAEGAVVIAESQTRGRGRLGRTWFSPAHQGLWLSVLLRPSLAPQAVTQITIAGATALARAIHKTLGLQPDIKWPNDLLVRGRKLAGILPEMHADPDRMSYVVVGIGINANQMAADFPEELRDAATSLRIETGALVDRALIAAALLTELDADYARICSGAFEPVADEWEGRCSTLGALITVHHGNRTLRGRAESLDNDGALLLRTQHGHLERVTGGDVTIDKEC